MATLSPRKCSYSSTPRTTFGAFSEIDFCLYNVTLYCMACSSKYHNSVTNLFSLSLQQLQSIGSGICYPLAIVSGGSRFCFGKKIVSLSELGSVPLPIIFISMVPARFTTHKWQTRPGCIGLHNFWGGGGGVSVKPRVLHNLKKDDVQSGTSYKLNCSAYGDSALKYS